MLASLKQLNLQPTVFDTENKVIKIGSVILDQPVFSQYDYTGNRPEDTTKTILKKDVEKITGLQWNTEGWHVSVNNISLKDGAIAIEREGRHL